MPSIQDCVVARDIKILLHFTRLENLDSILRRGIVPRSLLKDKKITALVNDEYRFDGYPDASCLSISFPNYRMFYALRKKDEETSWAVIALRPSILWTYDCAFCADNAASIDISAIDLETRKGAAAFEKLFEDFPNKPTRKTINLIPKYPTCPQAEVLVFGPIKTEDIIGAYLPNSNLVEKYKDQFGNKYDFKYLPKIYSYRSDWNIW